jgi:hypothetical protein
MQEAVALLVSFAAPAKFVLQGVGLAGLGFAMESPEPASVAAHSI